MRRLADSYCAVMQHVMIPRGTAFPTKASVDTRTAKDGQNQIGVRVFEGERAQPSLCTELGSTNIYNIPPAPRDKQMTAITYSLDADGIFTVFATVQATGPQQ